MFHQRLDGLLKAALERRLLTPETAEALRHLAKEQVKERGALTLASVLGWLGGGAVVLGIILLIGSNWEGIGDYIKIAGFLILLGGTHAAGFWITRAGLPYERTAASCHFIGGGLFLAGVGLIAQIYHLSGRPPNGILLWLVSLIPLVILLRSASLGLMAIFALLTWLHMEGAFPGSVLRLADSFALHLMIELGMGVALVGFSGAVQRWDKGVAGVFRAVGALLLFFTIYALGFYRYYSASHAWYGRSQDSSGLQAWGMLALGAAGIAAGGRHLAPESVWLRNRLWILLGAALGVGALLVGVEIGSISEGARIEHAEVGGWRRTTAAAWALTVLAWALWFLLALWCIAWGAKSDRKAFVNLGVLAVGAGIITRFFDLVGTLAETGTLFLLGGGVLLGTAFGMEKWRRRIVKQMQAGKAGA